MESLWLSLQAARNGDGHDEGEQARAQRGVRGRNEVEQESQHAKQEAREGEEDAQRGATCGAAVIA